MLRRKVLPQIEEWYQSGCKKALLLTGARQVGKTTAVREFAKLHYTNFVEVNFVTRPMAQQAFGGDLKPEAGKCVKYLIVIKEPFPDPLSSPLI